MTSENQFWRNFILHNGNFVLIDLNNISYIKPASESYSRYIVINFVVKKGANFELRWDVMGGPNRKTEEVLDLCRKESNKVIKAMTDYYNSNPN